MRTRILIVDVDIIDKNMKNTKQKFMHYAFQVVLLGFGAMTAGMIIFTFITILNETIL